MKEPSNFELKQWLCHNNIVGLRIHYLPTGADTTKTDTTKTEWELMTACGASRQVLDSAIKPLVVVQPDWIRVMQPTKAVRDEVKAYEAFAEEEAKDLADYHRLRAKFEN